MSTTNTFRSLSVAESPLSQWVFRVCFFLWPLVALLAAKATYIPFMLMGLASIYHHRFKLSPSNSKIWLSIAALWIWGLISSIWSIDPTYAIKESFKILPVYICGYAIYLYLSRLSRDQLDAYVKLFLISCGVVLIILVLDSFLGKQLQCILHKDNLCRTYARGTMIVGIGLWLLIQRMKSFGILHTIFVIGLCVLFMNSFDFDAGPLAVVFGLLIMGIALKLPSLVNRLMKYGLILTTLLYPTITPHIFTPELWDKIAIEHYHPSFQERFEMTDWGAKKVRENPLGYGFSQTRPLSDKDRIPTHRLENGKIVHGEWSGMAWHMHNGFLQIGVELGYIGLLLICALIWFGFSQLQNSRASDRSKAIMYGYLGAIIFMIAICYGIWQTWWLSTILFVTILNGLNLRDDHAE